MTNLQTDRFARQLIDCLNQFGTQQSNLVLDLLEHHQPVDKTRYPELALAFGNNQWRVFYHCHESPGKHDDEHGHFHIFTRSIEKVADKTDWSHLVALSMDNMGQPLQWFMVNQWVTAGTWFKPVWLDKIIDELSRQQEQNIIQKWFQSMLYLYSEEISYLLKLRDKNISFICNSPDLQSCFQDRDIYLLAVEPISLIEKLQTSLNTDISVPTRDGNVA